MDKSNFSALMERVDELSKSYLEYNDDLKRRVKGYDIIIDLLILLIDDITSNKNVFSKMFKAEIEKIIQIVNTLLGKINESGEHLKKFINSVKHFSNISIEAQYVYKTVNGIEMKNEMLREKCIGFLNRFG